MRVRGVAAAICAVGNNEGLEPTGDEGTELERSMGGNRGRDEAERDDNTGLL